MLYARILSKTVFVGTRNGKLVLAIDHVETKDYSLSLKANTTLKKTHVFL